jgi:hypothetical protein
MGYYLNRDSKQAIFCLFAIRQFMESLAAHTALPEQKKVKRSIDAVLNHLNKIIDHTMALLDPDAAHGVYRFSKDVVLMCMTNADPRRDAEYLVVKRDEAMRIIASNDECLWCEKCGKEIERCELKKIALRWQLIPLGKGECPFRREY